MQMSRGMYGFTAEEIEYLERRQASLDRDIKPRLEPKRRPAPKNGWDSLTAADIACIAAQIKQALHS
jgi:hypothetical protein